MELATHFFSSSRYRRTLSLIEDLLRVFHLADLFERYFQARGIAVPVLLELGRVEVGDGRGDLLHRRFELGRIRRRLYCRPYPGNDGRRRRSGDEHARPDVELRVVAQLLEGGDFGQQREALAAPARKRAHLAAADL